MGKLTATGIRHLNEPGRYTDGQGLLLFVRPDGSRSWVLRLQHEGRRRDFGLGSADRVSLADARRMAFKMREAVKSGVDPIKAKSSNKDIPNFKAAALAVIREKEPAWRDSKSARQWLQSLETYAFPALGRIKVNEVTASQVRDVLVAIWLEKPETARRLKQRIGTILDWAFSKGYRETEAPMRAIGKGLPTQRDRRVHFKALDYTAAPAFMSALNTAPRTTGRQALQFLILTAARSGEVRNAIWSEIDFEKELWVIPAERMKAGVEHVVPLSASALAILKSQMENRTSNRPLIFEGSRPGRPLSDMTLTKILRDMKLDVTVHGFRSCFRDWTAETTATSHEVAEKALAHTIKNQAEAAYRRGSLLEKRRVLMNAWADFLYPKANPSKVVNFEWRQ